jgi:peroxiredoxin
MRKLGPVLLLLLGAVACGTDDPGAQVARAEPIPPSTSAPPLNGTRSDGESFDLRELHGKRVLLIFYRSAGCGLCLQQLSALAADHKAYHDLDTKIIAVTADPPEINRKTADLLDQRFPIITVDHATLTRWGAWSPERRSPQPATFIIDERGNVLYQKIGASAADRLSDVAIVFTLRSLDRAPPRNGSP